MNNDYEIAEFADPGLILKMMDPDIDMPEVPELPVGMSLASQTPTGPKGVEGIVTAIPSAPMAQITPMPEVAPAAPQAPKPLAKVGASDGLSQLQQKTKSSEDSRADSLFEE
jgi:hypothetical protein